MFATLVITLPGEYEGGEFVIEFDNKRTTIEKHTNKFDIQYTAFYADCSHELLEVKSGYRLSLVYNLTRGDKSVGVGPAAAGNHVDSLVPLLKKVLQIERCPPQAYILEHQYTPENFSMHLLKRNDNLKTEVIIEAARQAGMYVNVGLLTHYLIGEIDQDGGYDYYSRDIDPEDCEIGEVHDSSTELENWILGGVPKVGTLSNNEIDILNEKNYSDEEPLQKEAEGYTGNAGMTAEYWYHYGAVIFGSNESIIKSLQQSGNNVKLEWINYFFYGSAKNIQKAKELLFSLDPTECKSNADYGSITPVVLQLNEAEIEKVLPLLSHCTDLISNENLLQIINYLKTDKVAQLITDSLHLGKLSILLKWLQIIDEIETGNLPVKVKMQAYYPEIFSKLDLLFKKEEDFIKNDYETKIAIIERLILINTKVNFQILIQRLFTTLLNRKFLYNVLYPALSKTNNHCNDIWKQLQQIAINKLQADTEKQPVAPTDWARDFPDIAVNTDKLKMLKDFLLNADLQRMVYVKAERERNEVTMLIGLHHLDISHSVIKKGSPHQLLMVKNENSYLRKLKIFKEDVELLKALND